MQSLSVPHAGSGGLSWQRAALTAAADVGALAAISGGFVASLYVWREARGPLCALLPSVGLPEAATNLRYYYDRDHPSNIAKRCLSIAVVAVAGVGYLVFDEMRAARRGGAALRLATSASAGASASSFLSTFADASLSVLRRHFVGSGATRHIGAAAFVTATLFAGVIATKVFFPSERGALPDDSSSDESEATSELEGDGEDAVGGGNAYDRREGGDTYVNASGGGRRQRGRRSGAAAADGGEYESSSITAADGARGGGALATSASSATSISNNNSSGSSSSGGETPRRRVATTNTRASLVSNNPFSRGATEMGAGTIRPLRVDRDASRGLRAFKTRRRRWQILRNLVFAPFVEELIFRAVMLRVIRGGAESNATSSEIGEFRYPPSALYALLATGFSLAHLHHIVLNSVRAYQQSFDPLEPEAAQTSAAWARGAKVTGAQLAMTAVFTYLNTFIYRTVAGENVIAAAIAHSLCNYLGPPSLAYLSFYPTPPSPAASSSSSSTGLSFSDEKGSAAQSDKKKKKKKGGLKGLVSRVKGCAKAVCVRLQPSRVSHATKLRAISVSYGCGIVGFLGLVVAFRRRAAS